MHIAITGASGGLGSALAAAYAAKGVRLSLAGRAAGRLEECARTCRGRGAEAAVTAFDIRDSASLSAWLNGAEATAPLDLVFANAGVSATSRPERLEHPEDADRLLDINAKAAIRTAAIAAGLMTGRGKGSIVIVSSLAGLQTLPLSPAYCAGKAAARVYGLSLRVWLKPFGVGVTVVCPGYVDTPMSDRLESAKPFLWPAEKAALHIKKRLLRNPREIVFPWQLAAGIRLESLLPERIRDCFLRRFSFRVKPDRDSPEGGGHG
ncbi:MAG: SDR family NAD(P)-dependent oxidoreductase [Planctomycetes bacterium]|nr:SDR family NAD(P)-dependent oxidoreductase [Planctomycetota bacterium]